MDQWQQGTADGPFQLRLSDPPAYVHTVSGKANLRIPRGAVTSYENEYEYEYEDEYDGTMARTREEALKLGIKVRPIQHRMTRRASWNKYWKRGRYGITIHINEDENGDVERCLLLSEVVGKITLPFGEGDDCVTTELTELGRLVKAKLDQIGTHNNEDGVRVTNAVIMPTHIHATLQLEHDLPVVRRGKHEERYHLGRIVGYFMSGCTSWFRRWMNGESVEEILARPNWRDLNKNDDIALDSDSRQSPRLMTDVNNNGANAPSELPSMWQEGGFNDKVLTTERKYINWNRYVDNNARFWKLQMDYPHLFKHRLHLTIAGSDYSSYGGLFILYRGERVQIKCHRLARRGMLTEEEWQKATASWDAIRAFENYSRQQKLGHFDRDWYRSNNPNCITAVPYTRTEAFRKQKAEILYACEQGTVPVSPAISLGEKEIFYAALEAGFPCIKLQAKAITEREHPIDRDREYCARGLLVVLGPWKIKDTNNYASRFGDADSKYAQFHNLNDMAAEMCGRDVNEETLDVDPITLAECR